MSKILNTKQMITIAWIILGIVMAVKHKMSSDDVVCWFITIIPTIALDVIVVLIAVVVWGGC